MRLFALFNPLGDSPCFCVPVFMEGTQTYTQAINDEGKISGFDICSVPHGILIKSLKALDIGIGAPTLYSFYFGPSDIVVGTKQQVSDRLRGEIALFDESPFLQYEIADFVGDERTKEAAGDKCLRLLSPHPAPKKIKNFIFTSRRGFLIDLEDARLAITVTPNDRDIIFHEGSGPDRFSGVSVSGKAVQRFELGRFEGMLAVNLLFTRGSRTETYLIGITEDEDSALAWIERVNKIYEKKRETIEIRADGYSN